MPAADLSHQGGQPLLPGRHPRAQGWVQRLPGWLVCGAGLRARAHRAQALCVLPEAVGWRGRWPELLSVPHVRALVAQQPAVQPQGVALALQ